MSVPVVSCSGQSGSDRVPRPVKFRTQTMGTWATLTLVTTDSAGVADLAYSSLRVLHHVDSIMSNWTQTSDVARINRKAGIQTCKVHPEVAAVLDVAQQIADQSDGAFDITIEPLVRLWGFLGSTPRIPVQNEIDSVLRNVGRDKILFNSRDESIEFLHEGVQIDLGGIAKGYGVDRVAQLLKRSGAGDALIDLSGNMVALGDAAGHPGWAVGIRDPSGKVSWLARLVLHNEAVATSGDYEQFVDSDGKRYGHILDPRTGWSVRSLSSVTVVCSRAIVADAWATAFFVMGPEEARILAGKRDDLSVILIEPVNDDSAVIWVEENLRERFELIEQLQASHSIKYF